MADKQKDNKLMSMLEKSGILRKSDGDSSDGSYDSMGYDSDIKPLFDVPDEVVTVKSAPKQPVPGMPTPVLPSEKPADTVEEMPPVTEVPKPRPEPVVAQERPPKPVQPTPPPPSSALASSMFGDPPVSQTPPTPVSQPEPQKPAQGYAGLNLFRGSSDNGVSEPISRDSDIAPQPDNYTDRYLDINQLYDALALRSKKTDTIYLIEDYLATLPNSLPDSQRREIVAKLLESSGFDFDLLMGDGVLRVKMLKEYAGRFARHTDDYIAARQAELDELDQQMARTRRLIENRKELHKRQFYTIEAEAQRLKEILSFVSG